ncbi:phospholipid carrier-dependent glycosyltransferase [Geomonas anaerohicana]|uniref:Glycosyltransferase family 39 protein n=1 Tax=Geomonas anaerohicana TaxID=2798583 RepID=A0ABS0YG83_9BACT|nr:glycosyltransferase family 39 protein [Geomonas anaerohicana]MBJ6751333.1 glycosyltransferase family 39 protein [Geomonas anaerohicana]
MPLQLNYLTRPHQSRRRDLLLLTLLFGLLFLQLLGHFPLIDPDETRYAEIPREMLERGDLITPLLNYVKYFEKPVLLYWLNAFSFSLFGISEFSARLFCALSGLGTVLFSYHLGRELFGRRTGLLAALVLGGCTGFLIQARINITDIPLTFTMTVALGSYILAARDADHPRPGYYYLFYLFAALAVLAKGLIGIVLPGAVVFWHIVLTRRWRILKEMRLVTGFLLFLAVAAPWFVLVCQRNPEFFQFFFIHEHFERFLTKVHRRYQPVWYFIPILFGFMIPWSFFIPTALRNFWRNRAATGGEARLYLALWAIIIFAFFSKSNSKLPAYILPVYPALAILIAGLFDRAFNGDFRPLRRPALASGGLLVLLGCAALLYPLVAHRALVGPIGGLVIGSIVILQGAVVLAAAKREDPRQLFVGLLAGSILLFLTAPHIVFPLFVERKSYREPGQIVKKLAAPDAVLVSQGLRQGLSYYAERRCVIFDGPGEIEFGSKIGDQSAWFLNRDGFRALWNGPKPVYAMILRDYLGELSAGSAVKPRILWQSSKHYLVTNR